MRTRVSALTLALTASAKALPFGLGIAPTHAYSLPEPSSEEVSNLNQAWAATLADELYPLHHENPT